MHILALKDPFWEKSVLEVEVPNEFEPFDCPVAGQPDIRDVIRPVLPFEDVAAVTGDEAVELIPK